VYSKKYKTIVLTSNDSSDDYLFYLLNKKKINRNKSYILIDTVIVDKDHRNKN